MPRAGLAAVAITILVASVAGCSRPGTDSRTPAPQPVVPFIVDAFDRHPIVALSEVHGNEESHALFRSLVRDASFRAAVQDIVVEFGNGLHQPAADRYVAGEDVPEHELKRIWAETTQVTGVFLAPMYGQMLAEVRSVNATLPAAKRLRVWLGDPPIDWSLVTSGADDDMNDWRDAWFARVVTDRIRAHQRNAFVFAGGGHLSRKVRFPNSLIHLLDDRRPGETFVVSVVNVTHAEPPVAARLRQWPVGVAASVKGTWLGDLDVSRVGFEFSTGRLEVDVDAIALLSHGDLVSVPPPSVDPNSLYGKEVERRQDLARKTQAFRGTAVRFGAEEVRLAAGADQPLGEILAVLQRERDLHLLVKAFADGDERDPIGLSERRAALVVDWFAERGVARDRLQPRGCGAGRPLTFGVTESDRALNRRAELVRVTPMAGCEPPW